VGFAAESEDVLANARRKLEKKQLDIIVANDITDAGSGFDADTNKVTLIDRNGNVEDLPLMTKREVADRILGRVVGLLAEHKAFEKITVMLSSRQKVSEGRIDIPKNKRELFPDYKKQFSVEASGHQYQRYLNRQKDGKDHFHLRPWFRTHPELTVGDKVLIQVIEPMKKYSLEIARE
jgi:hypothetical protein